MISIVVITLLLTYYFQCLSVHISYISSGIYIHSNFIVNNNSFFKKHYVFATIYWSDACFTGEASQKKSFLNLVTEARLTIKLWCILHWVCVLCIYVLKISTILGCCTIQTLLYVVWFLCFWFPDSAEEKSVEMYVHGDTRLT